MGRNGICAFEGYIHRGVGGVAIALLVAGSRASGQAASTAGAAASASANKASGSAASTGASAATTAASGQAGSAEMTFDVATIKPSSTDRSQPFDWDHAGIHISPGRAAYGLSNVKNLVEYAYDLLPFQVTGPAWMTVDQFDIVGTFPAGVDQKALWTDSAKRLQALLGERFQLKFHIEQKALDAYVLEAGKHGIKLTPSPALPAPKAGAGAAKAAFVKNADGSNTWDMGERGTQRLKYESELQLQHWELSRVTMEDLASRLVSCLGPELQKVTDETGLKGVYPVAFDCPLPLRRSGGGEDAGGTVAADPEDGSPLTRSLDAMGLRLEKRKVLQDVYVIDHVERPSEN